MWFFGHGLEVDLKVLGEWLDLTLKVFNLVLTLILKVFTKFSSSVTLFLPSVFQPVCTKVREEQQIMPQANRRQEGGFEDSG